MSFAAYKNCLIFTKHSQLKLSVKWLGKTCSTLVLSSSSIRVIESKMGCPAVFLTVYDQYKPNASSVYYLQQTASLSHELAAGDWYFNTVP